MASTELLGSKIVVLEETPQIPAITALPSAVLLVCGITERGPIGDPVLLTSFDEYVRTFGGFTATGDVAMAVYGFFSQGGSFCWVVRTCHYTNLTNPTSYAATKGSVALANTGASATPAVLGPGSTVAPWVLDPGDIFHLTLAGGADTATFDAAAASITDGATWPISALGGTETMAVTIAGANGGLPQTLTGPAGATTAIVVAAALNAQIVGAQVDIDGGHIKIVTDRMGTGARVQVTTGGTLNAILAFPTSAASGTGDVSDIKAVTAAEVKTVIENDIAGVAVTSPTGHIVISTVTTGPGATLIQTTGDMTFGLDLVAHAGATTAPVSVLTIQGKTPGAYTDTIRARVAAPTSGVASQFTLQVLVEGVVKETFPNLTMDPTKANYVEAIVNNANFGSALIEAIDLDVPVLTPTQLRPINVTSAYLSGGADGLGSLADTDFLGNAAGPTGLHAFNRVSTGRILCVPNRCSQVAYLGICDYAEVTRNGSMFAVLDPAAGKTGAEMVADVDSYGLLEYSEFAAIYWPRIKVANPAPDVYGTDSAITVPPSGWIAGKYAANDQLIGGIYESPAGVDRFGVIRGMLGVEDDPAGTSRHPVLEQSTRDLVYPSRINPITKIDGYPWFIDGGRTLKSTGNFPNVGERRGVIFIEQTLKQGLEIMRHRYNNAANRRKVSRICSAFLRREMNKGAFRSQVPSTAFFVDCSDQLNPPSAEYAGILTARIGLATNKPAEFIVLLVTQDTRALALELAAS